ncbi:UDP-GlcNAc:betaGal beta-1,3-N-acetylglucosaminyltransferase-like protein 1 isoform X8 [Phacochoerus africanus]|uniref:UDP-GlcNAc:betaGal beta-1,3-N-acetylglucosaminyltransferase-like protein 1 isoform X8 n=1 Tax=Phacochoerus africanus TaxID=41426 RepID=UPI001FD8E41E|nr:UDP-GlcNAc:betaGal beta-1,3-N-acetylglucosaminyltransferase-like protein 1 isoform X8 [Phacochoerus africanus]
MLCCWEFGYSKNQAVAQSSGAYLCFLDSDDVMMPQRVRLQHAAAAQHPTSIIGCQVQREPPDSTQRYTRWLNQLEPGQLLTQAFTSHGPTVPMPTWFCSRAWFSHVGPFDEGGRGVPEDLLFFYEHLRKGGGLVRVDRSLLVYRYHPAAATHAVLETTIWTLRVRFLEEQALPRWATFTIWNAGRQGRRLYRSLTAESRHKVVAFCDVDENKIQKGFYCHEESQERPKPRIPVLHFRAARPPFVICVKLVTCLPPLEKRLLRSFACFLWVTAVQRRRKSSLRFPPKAPSGASANALPTPNRPLSTSCSTLTKSIFCFCLTAPVLVSQLRNHHPIQGRKDSSLCFL